MKIKQIDNDTALHFLRKNHASREVVFIKPHDVFVGCFIDGVLVGVSGYDVKGDTVKISSSFTAKEHRGKGVSTAITGFIIMAEHGKKFVAYSRPEKAKINERFGFVVKRTYSNGTVKMEKDT